MSDADELNSPIIPAPIDRETLVTSLRAQRAHVEQAYGLRMVGLIGSAARGEVTSTSDIDVWVDIVETPTLFTISRAERAVAEGLGLGRDVDFVFYGDIRPSIRARMERDLVRL